MDVYLTVLRLIHILAGVYWVGSALLLVLFIMPTIRSMGVEGHRFLGRLSANRLYTMAFPVSALATTLAGVLLYERITGGFDMDYIQSTSGVVLTIGALAGIGALGHGGAALGPRTGKYAQLCTTAFAQGTPSSEQLAALDALQAELDLHGRISAVLMVVAVVCMAGARYM